MPEFVPGLTEEASFTQDVEKLCGPRAQGAFQSQYGYHALSPDWVKNREMPPEPEDMEAMSCLLSTTTVAGFKVGLIGNEAFATTE